jgi:hypothetical protein
LRQRTVSRLLRTDSYSSVVIDTRSVQVSLAHSQIHSPTDNPRPEPSFKSSMRSLISRNSDWFLAARSSRSRTSPEKDTSNPLWKNEPQGDPRTSGASIVAQGGEVLSNSP